MLAKLITNPLFIIGAIGGVSWMYKNRPQSRATRIFRELEEGGRNLFDSTTGYASEFVDEVIETSQDVWDIVEEGDADGDIDAGGSEGGNGAGQGTEDENTGTDDSGDGSDGGNFSGGDDDAENGGKEFSVSGFSGRGGSNMTMGGDLDY